MKTLNKLALSSAIVALSAGTAFADATLTVGTGGTIGELGTPINLAAGSNFLQQNGTLQLVIGEGATADFGLSGNAATITFNLTGTGFVLNGAPTPVTTGTCAAGTFTVGTAGPGDSSFTVTAAATFEANCGTAGNEAIFNLPVILTNTDLGNTASANISIAASAATTVEIVAAELADNIVEVVEPFDAAVTASALLPDLSLDTTPVFAGFVATPAPVFTGVLGTVNVSQTGGGVVTEIAAETGVVSPANVTLTATVEDATGIDNITVAPALTLVNSVAAPNVFTLEVPAGSIGGFLGGDRNVSINLLQGDDAAMVSAQDVTFSVASANGTTAVPSASVTGALASLTRDGTSKSFDWVAFEPANLNNIFRFTDLDAGAQVFATVTNLNSVDANGSNRINDFDVTAAGLTSGTSAGGELQISAVALGDALVDAGLLDPDAVAITRGSVTFTIEQSNVEVNRLMFNADGAVNSTTDWNQN
ncbi:hypothetical protein JCM17846_33630 [Iodidimonas nitroreducens]|uniref:Uncharacterized protein n=1 Tax=Iodidimonas nitroreducens TaxID=1236968 RepID=A0A5A7NBC2_9PROT|nr:hypothetical protein [Iodidimonas nitroreducens]GAK34434.1 hypothetical protein AQ1_02333 [alpha proteobacterium Q-1]GER05681.1 hypothetical protein JCM17846_33630 [Iodidimonas nitroreducens]